MFFFFYDSFDRGHFKQFSEIWHCAFYNSVVTFGCCPCLRSAVIPVRCSARTLSVAIAAGCPVGCLLRSVTSVLLSRTAAGGDVRAPEALMMPSRSCASLLVRIRRAPGVATRTFCRRLPANTPSQSMKPASSPLMYSLYCPRRLQRPSEDCKRAWVMWKSLIAILSRSMCSACTDSAVTCVMRVLVALCVCAPRVLIRR